MNRTALLVVDVQNAFCHPEGSRARAVGLSAALPTFAIVPVIVELVATARTERWPVWFTMMEYWADDVMAARRRFPPAVERLGGSLDVCRGGTWDADLVDELTAVCRPDDVLLPKHRSSAFYQTPLEQQLRMRNVGTLVVVGTTTSYCVESTIRDAHARDFDVVVPREAVADTDPAAQMASLASIDRFHGVVCSTIDLVQRLEGARYDH
jgi:ureidoacrylate peracid hydrolase